jgi:hypothetical protein
MRLRAMSMLLLVALGPAGCAGRAYPRPMVASGVPVDLATLPACARPPVDSTGWSLAVVPDQAGLALRVPPGLPVQSTRRIGVRTTEYGTSKSPLAVAVRRVDVTIAQDVPLVWPDGRGPMADSGLSIACNDCMETERRCVERIAGAPRFVAIGRMTGWDSQAIAYATWEVGPGVWQVIEVNLRGAPLSGALAVLRSAEVAP